jgi:hypothetical protein
METLNSGDLVDLWESQDDRGKLHINYNVYLNPVTFSIYGAHGLEECIIVSSKIVFLSYQEQTLFSSIPILVMTFFILHIKIL